MALTDDVKEELARVRVTRPQTKAAEVATLLRFAGGLHVISNRVAVESELDSAAAARRLARSILELYGVRAEIATISSSSNRTSGARLTELARDLPVARGFSVRNLSQQRPHPPLKNRTRRLKRQLELDAFACEVFVELRTGVG